jgi:hypothetical protein
MIGWFFDAIELTDVFEWSHGSMSRDVVAIANDGGDNFVCVTIAGDDAGLVSFWLHDAPANRQLYALAPSLETFLRSLHRANSVPGTG